MIFSHGQILICILKHKASFQFIRYRGAVFFKLGVVDTLDKSGFQLILYVLQNILT